MKQIVQDLRRGVAELIEVPAPVPGAHQVVVAARTSLVSAGTERMLTEFGRASLLGKAWRHSDRVRQVLDKARTDGVVATWRAVTARLDAPLPMGYSSSGVTTRVGSEVRGVRVGDRVVSSGPHAELAAVPAALVARVPDAVGDEAACFAPVGAVGLQGVRLAGLTLGETVVIYGLGLIGLLSVQLARAAGCTVIGIDPDPTRRELGQRFGATCLDGARPDLGRAVIDLTGGRGADAVLMTLASSDDGPIHHAAQMSRRRGRIVLVGTTGLTLRRDDFHRKELTFTVSAGFGPGRGDPDYEARGHDYPLGFVRWTAQRNMEAVLSMLATGAVDPAPLISHRLTFADAGHAYRILAGSEPSLGILLEYPDRPGTSPAVAAGRPPSTARPRPAAIGAGVAVIGAGNYAIRTLLPALRALDVPVSAIVSRQTVAAATAARTFTIARVTSTVDEILADPGIGVVFIVTRHDSHPDLAVRALERGKHVFVEKPLALDLPSLDRVAEAARSAGTLLTVGFNRRFAPLTRALHPLLATRTGPLSLVMTVNAGAVDATHWVHHPLEGGGRLLGEGCHFIDLARSLVGHRITTSAVLTARGAEDRPLDDTAHLTLGFADGSTASINYLAQGAASFPKEQLLAFGDGKVHEIDNWRVLRRFGYRGWNRSIRSSFDKGHRSLLAAWFEGIAQGRPPIPLEEVLEVSRFAIEVGATARQGVVPG
jgi:predicted dehydrogenase/threonine dehydrogenase-like Zn-dependent dehydrogenase